MSKPLDYLTGEKKELLDSDWLSNTFVRYKIINTQNSLTEAIVRVFQRGEYRRNYSELEKFYKQIADHLRESSDSSAVDIYTNIFQDSGLQKYLKNEGIVLVKSDDKLLKNITFYYKDKPNLRFNFFPYIVRNLKDNCNLIKYFSQVDISLPYNYFKVRTIEKLNYLEIVNNVEKIKKEIDEELCNETIYMVKEKNILNDYLSFIKNLFSRSAKRDYKYYLYLYPRVFNINFIIYTPFENGKIMIENIIEINPDYPYLILCQPFRSKSLDLKIELGGLMIKRRIVFMLKRESHEKIIEDIKSRYYSKLNSQLLIDYLRVLKGRTYSRYLKDYDLEKNDKDIYTLLDKIKYYNYEI